MWFWNFLVFSVEWVICLLVCGFTFSRRFWSSQEVQIIGNDPITTALRMPALACIPAVILWWLQKHAKIFEQPLTKNQPMQDSSTGSQVVNPECLIRCLNEQMCWLNARPIFCQDLFFFPPTPLSWRNLLLYFTTVMSEFAHKKILLKPMHHS